MRSLPNTIRAVRRSGAGESVIIAVTQNLSESWWLVTRAFVLTTASYRADDQ